MQEKKYCDNITLSHVIVGRRIFSKYVISVSTVELRLEGFIFSEGFHMWLCSSVIYYYLGPIRIY